VGGDPKKGANCHKVKILDPAGEEIVDPSHPDKAKVPGITVVREGWTDYENLNNYEEDKPYGDGDHHARDYDTMNFCNLILDVEVS